MPLSAFPIPTWSVQEVRNDASRYPYLLQSSRSAWLSCPNGGADGKSCMGSNDWLQRWGLRCATGFGPWWWYEQLAAEVGPS